MTVIKKTPVSNKPFSTFAPLVLVVLASLIQHWLRPLLGLQAFLLLYPAIFLGSLMGTFASSFVATAVGTLLAWYFFMPDLHSLLTTSQSDVLGLVVFFSTGLLANFFGEHRKVTKLNTDFERQARIFDAALSSSPDFHYVFDLNHRFTYVNQGLLKLWGKPLHEVIGKNFKDLGYPPELVQLHESQLNEVLKGKTVRGENAYTSPEGVNAYYEYQFIPIFSADGVVQAISGTTRDVTERKLSEESRLEKQRLDLLLNQIKENEKQFRDLADSMPQLAWIAREDGYIFWYNQGWYRYTGTTPEQMEGWGWQAVHHPEHLPHVMERWPESIATGKPFDMEFPLRAADGSFRWFLTRATPIRDLDGKVIRWFGTNTDIHDQKGLGEELKKAVAMRDEFLSIASHELKTPITSLKMHIQMTQRSLKKGAPPPPEKLEQILDGQAQQVNRLVTLIEELLDVSKIQAGKLTFHYEEFDLATAAKEVVGRFDEELASLGCSATIRADRSVPIYADKFRIEQVLINLLTNAIKYGSGRPIEVRVERSTDAATVAVIDHGIGIQEDKLEKIFDRYERVVSHNNIGGLGLGLYIVREIVRGHHGQIRVASTLGKGTAFSVELPVRKSS